MRLLAIGLLLALGCGDDVDVGREPRDAAIGNTDAAVDAGCMATLEVTLALYQHLVVTGFVRCQGQHLEGIEGDGRTLSAGFQTCTPGMEPDRIPFKFRWEPVAGPCEFCTGNEAGEHCFPIESGCGAQTLDEVPVTWGACDGGVDDDSGAN